MKNATKLIEGSETVVAPMHEIPMDTLTAFQQADKLYFDTETTGLSAWRSEIALIQLYDPNSKKVFLGRVFENWQPNKWFTDLFTSNRTIIGHNIAQFDIPFLSTYNIDWKPAKYFDTLIGETVIATSGRSDVSKSLRASVRRRAGFEVDKDIAHGGWRNPVLSEEQIQYAATDVLVLPELYNAQIENATRTNQLTALQIEMDVLPVFASMNINGLPISMENLSRYMEMQEVKIVKAKELLLAKLGDINYNSYKQVLRALSECGIDLESTAKDVLIDIILFDPESENAQLLQALLDFRAPNKRTTMYGSSEWQEEHIQADGHIHAQFWQVGADTTRVSSSDPNLQQVPKDGRWIIGFKLGYLIISVDYSQIEVRISANIGKDAALIALLEDDDVHRSIAAQVYSCSPRDVTPKQRKLAKAMVFTLLFGGSPRRFHTYAKHNGSDITFDEAIHLFRRFFESFVGLWNMRQKAKFICSSRRAATITLPGGYRRVLAGNSLRPAIMLNTPVQGTAAVGMKLGLIEAGRRGLDKYLGAVVHDEAVACVPEEYGEEYAIELHDSLVKGMQRVVSSCPVKAEIARINRKDIQATGLLDLIGDTPDGALPNFWLA